MSGISPSHLSSSPREALQHHRVWRPAEAWHEVDRHGARSRDAQTAVAAACGVEEVQVLAREDGKMGKWEDGKMLFITPTINGYLWLSAINNRYLWLIYGKMGDSGNLGSLEAVGPRQGPSWAFFCDHSQI